MRDYLEKHNACGLKVGDRVRVAETEEQGWDNDRVFGMNEWVGREGEIVRDDEHYGFMVRFYRVEASPYRFPYFVLEKVED